MRISEAAIALSTISTVAKRVDAPYRLARRSAAWIKVKHVTRTALPVVKVRDDAVLVGDADSFRPLAWVDRFHPSGDHSCHSPPRVTGREDVLAALEYAAAYTNEREIALPASG